MLEMVTSSVMGEAMSGVVSLVFSSHGEKVSQEILMERLEMAHINLSSALVRSRMIPITIMPLLCKKKKLKEVFEECDDLLGKARDCLQVVPSLGRKIMHVVLPSFIIPNQDVLSSSVIGRFEWFAMEADKFVRDVESGSSLSHYRFLNSLTGHLLVGKSLSYRKVQGTQICSLWIWTASVEEYGRVARLSFGYKDSKEPLKSFHFILILRLYESTNIVGVGVKCLQSLGPQFKSLGEIATGELTQVPTQDVSYYDSVSWKDVDLLTTGCCPDPFCCISNVLNKPHALNSIASELTRRFPQEIMLVGFDCGFSASECCARSSADETCINTIKSWPPLEMSVTFTPHDLSPEFRYGSSLRKIEEGIQRKAIDYFMRHPELTEYDMFWDSAHGCALFRVSKPVTKTRRASKRRR